MSEALITECMDKLVDIQRHQFGLKSRESIAQRLLKSVSRRDFEAGGQNMVTTVPNTELKAITSALTVSDPLSQPYRTTIDVGTRRRIQIRDLLPSFTITEGQAYVPVKNSVTHGSPIIQPSQGSAAGYGAITFSNQQTALTTFINILRASKQVLDDSGNLDALINTELLHGIALEVEDEIVNGTGSGESLNGLLANATAWTNESPNVSSEADVIRSAMKQIALADFTASAILLNPSDWFDIETGKAGASDDTYTGGAPRIVGAPMLWGLPVVETNTIASGEFLVGDFARCGIMFDQGEARIDLSLEDGDNLAKNMVSIRAIERLGMVVTNPLALVTGSL